MVKNNSDGLFVQDRGRTEKRGKGSDNNKNKSRSKSKGVVKTCWICGKEGHFKRQCNIWRERNKPGSSGEASTVTSQTIDAATLMVSNALLGFADVTADTWVLDTGCSFHMTCRRDWIMDFEETETGKVRMGNDTYSEVKGIGNIRVENADGSTILLSQVRYIPEMSKNLISLGTLEDKGCWFESREGVLKIYKDDLLVLMGKNKGLYIFSKEPLTLVKLML